MNQPSPFPEQLVDFWMAKAVEWGQALTPAAQLDVTLRLVELKEFLQRIHQELQAIGCTREAMRTRPFVGQLLGRLCWNVVVTADRESRACLLQCLYCMYSARPEGAVELKANRWIQKLLCHLSSVEESSTADVVKHVSGTPREYHVKLLKNTVALLVKDIAGASCGRGLVLGECPCERVHRISVSCVPLVTCPEAAPLIGALLQRPALCNKADLCEAFLESVSTGLLGQKLVLEDEAVISLWCQSLSSLERATIHLLECALSDLEPSAQELERLVTASLLPKASAHHCPLFLVVYDIFRAMLRRAPRNLALQAVFQVFTRCFLQAWAQVAPQDRLPLRAFFPDVPPSLLVPLLKLPSEVPEGAWPGHLLWVSCTLQKTLEDDEEGYPRWRREPFGAWLLLVQCCDWLGVAAQLLALSSTDSSAPLLWLLTFYHHQGTAEHSTLAVAEKALHHLSALFPGSSVTPALPATQEHIQVLMDLMTSCSPHTSSACLVLHLVVSFSLFSPGPMSAATELLHTLKVRSDLSRDALELTATLQSRLRGQHASARLRTIQDILR